MEKGTPTHGRGVQSPLQVDVLEERTLLSVYTVNRLTDQGVGDGLAGDLRYCISRAISGTDTIKFGITGTINLTEALPDLTTNVSIEGPGASCLTVRRDSGSDYTIFVVTSRTTVLISGLTIANGLDPGGTDANQYGRGIRNSGTLTVSDGTVTGNTSMYGGGGIYNVEGVLTVHDHRTSDEAIRRARVHAA